MSSLTTTGVIRSAKSVEALNQQKQGERAVKRGRDLLRFLDNHLEEFIEDCRREGSASLTLLMISKRITTHIASTKRLLFLC